jgi:hypothetical protein
MSLFDWSLVKVHKHPDGTTVASIQLQDGRVLRVVGERAGSELWKTLTLMSFGVR